MTFIAALDRERGESGHIYVTTILSWWGERRESFLLCGRPSRRQVGHRFTSLSCLLLTLFSCCLLNRFYSAGHWSVEDLPIYFIPSVLINLPHLSSLVYRRGYCRWLSYTSCSRQVVSSRVLNML